LRTANTLTPEFERTLLSCLEKDPERRPQSVRELRSLLMASPRSGDWDAAARVEWWAVYDGAETTRATNINPGPGDAFPRELAGFGGRLCFSATDDGVSNWELWILTEPGVGVLEVGPAEDLLAAGIAGGPFAPVSIDYTLRNSGGATLEWTAAKTVPWLDLSAVEGSLAPGESTVVTVSVNATLTAIHHTALVAA